VRTSGDDGASAGQETTLVGRGAAAVGKSNSKLPMEMMTTTTMRPMTSYGLRSPILSSCAFATPRLTFPPPRQPCLYVEGLTLEVTVVRLVEQTGAEAIPR
jgi:hypothetical protein